MLESVAREVGEASAVKTATGTLMDDGEDTGSDVSIGGDNQRLVRRRNDCLLWKHVLTRPAGIPKDHGRRCQGVKHRRSQRKKEERGKEERREVVKKSQGWRAAAAPTTDRDLIPIRALVF